MSKSHFFYLLLFSCQIAFTQEYSLFDQLESLNSKKKYEETIILWHKNKYKPLKKEYFIYEEVALAFENLNKEDSAFIFYKKSLKGFEDKKDNSKIAEINLRIYDLLDSQLEIKIDKDFYFRKFEDYTKKSNDLGLLAQLSHRYAVKTFADSNPMIPKEHFLDALYYHKKSNNDRKIAGTYSNIGLLYLNRFKNTDSARYFLNKAIKLADSIKDYDIKWNALLNLGNTYKTEEQYTKAINTYLEADSLDLKKYSLNKKRLIYYHLQECLFNIDDFKTSYLYLLKYNEVKDSINLSRQNINISKIKEQYDNEKLRANNLEIESKRIKNRNLLIASIGVIFSGGLTAFLVYKNAKRKQRIAEQEKEIQIQKTDKILKEQELASIDAMLAGQEKERQRLANDLHDSLGGTLATVKLHFDHLKSNPNHKDADILYTKTDELLQEAYQKVRTIAHEKNSGVMANQGLLPAIKNLAKKVSYGNHLTIDIQDYGLEQRLDNHIEITIFRIIQELITNIIKHANATEIQISLTNHDAMLNIIVEDNGKGFDAKQLPQKDGMG